MTDVLIIGDSISIGYTPHAAAALGDAFTVVHNEGNASDSRNVLAHLDAYLAAAPTADVIHFNCGLHDLKRTGDVNQVPLADYETNLARTIEQLADRGATLIWGRTTPIHDERHAATHADWGRCQADVDAYNAAADRVMAAAAIAVDDLHAAVIAAGIDRCIRDDGVHMTDDGYVLLGTHVAAVIRDVRVE